MVDISGHTSAESGVHDPLVVQSEHVDPMVGLLVHLFSDIGQFRSIQMSKVSVFLYFLYLIFYLCFT